MIYSLVQRIRSMFTWFAGCDLLCRRIASINDFGRVLALLGVVCCIPMATHLSAETRLDSGENMIYWIDTRTQEEFDAGHIEGAVLIPFDVIAGRINEVTEDKTADIRVYCRSGRRSGIAMDTLKAMGFANVTNEGGYEEIIRR